MPPLRAGRMISLRDEGRAGCGSKGWRAGEDFGTSILITIHSFGESARGILG